MRAFVRTVSIAALLVLGAVVPTAYAFRETAASSV